LKADGITVLLASHLLHQVQAICDRVGLFRRGQMALEGTVTELARQVLGGPYRIQLKAENSVPPASGAGEGTDDVARALGQLKGVLRVNRSDGNLYELEAERDLRPEAAQAVVEAGGQLLSLDVDAPGLDEIYTHYFQQKEVEHVAADQAA
jgi:ABC-2 type transport system ATP-binding protein